jgi:hypothetical protein
MTPYQELWWRQATSDHAVLLLLRSHTVAPCHQLHYLQMITEKLGKAYFWRTGQPPRKSHASFVWFLQALSHRAAQDRTRIAHVLGFGRAEDFDRWIPLASPIAYDLERLAPALAGDNGPNTEYPWPRITPTQAPVTAAFGVWSQLTSTARGRHLLRVIDDAVRGFPIYA